jgi:type IV secretory pathway VirD2 relaxase
MAKRTRDPSDLFINRQGAVGDRKGGRLHVSDSVTGGKRPGGGHAVKPKLVKHARAVGSLRKTKPPKGSHKAFTRGYGKSTKPSFAPKQFMQRALVKVSFSSSSKLKGGGKESGAWGAHGKYLEREGAGIDGTKAQAFGSAVSDGKDLSTVLNEWQKAGDQRLWKLVVSPEFGDRMDMEAFTKEYVKRMEKELGVPLEWAAVCHYNTDNPHAHITIRGKDNLEISPGWIKNRSRQIASEIATEEIGYRTQTDITMAREKQIQQDRFTDLDREILKEIAMQAATSEDGRFHADSTTPKGVQLMARLDYLQKHGLAEKQPDNSWAVDPKTEKALREMGRMNDRTKMLSAYKSVITNPDAIPEVHLKLKAGERIMGRVVAAGDDEDDKAFTIIEGLDNRIHVIDGLGKLHGNAIKTGHLISLEAKPGKRSGSAFPKVEDFGLYTNGDIPYTATLRAQAWGVSPISGMKGAPADWMSRTMATPPVKNPEEIIERMRLGRNAKVFKSGMVMGTVERRGEQFARLMDSKGQAWLLDKHLVGGRLPKTGAEVLAFKDGAPIALKKSDARIAEKVRDGRRLIPQAFDNKMVGQAVENRAKTWERLGLLHQGRFVGAGDPLVALKDALEKQRDERKAYILPAQSDFAQKLMRQHEHGKSIER